MKFFALKFLRTDGFLGFGLGLGFLGFAADLFTAVMLIMSELAHVNSTRALHDSHVYQRR